MHSPRLRSLPRWLCTVLLLVGCPGDPPEVADTGTSTSNGSSSGYVPPPASSTDTGSPSTGVVDDTGTSATTGTGDQGCCTVHREAACDDPKLAACVCKQEAFCCAFAWDADCVALAEQCGGCGAATGTTGEPTTGGPESACCAPTEQPGCAEDPALETCVCGIDAFCCEQEWDGMCVQTAVRQCGAQCDEPADCCSPAGTPGCPGDPGLEACVCALDGFCCDQQWDGMCVQIAQDDCGLECNVVGGGDCCTANGTPGCDDPLVQDCVCALDDYCCSNEWDGICVAEAQYACMDACGLPPPNMGDCCMPQPGPGCDDMVVTDCTCDANFGCCLFPWSDECILLAVTECGIMCEGIEPLPPCCLPQPDPGCDDMVVQDCVCAFDGFCCDTEWDGQCVDEAQNDCMLDCSGMGMGGSSTG